MTRNIHQLPHLPYSSTNYNPIQVHLTNIISEHEPPGGQALPPSDHARVHLTRRFPMQLVSDGHIGPVEVVEPFFKGLREVNGFFSCDFGESGDEVRPVD